MDTIRRCLTRRKATQRSISLVAFDGKGLLEEFRDRYQVIELGWVHRPEKARLAYNSCDVFLMPSTAEAFGVMAV